MRSLKNILQKHGWELLLVSAAFVLLFLLLWFRLGSQTYGHAAPAELTTQRSSLHWRTILRDPLNAPYTILERLVLLTGHHGITSMRLISTMYAVLAIVLFYIVARQWHSMRVAILATWLFISSSWFLHTARLATPDILWLVGILGLVVLFSPKRREDHPWLSLPVTVATLSVLMYIPGMVWLVLLSLFIRRKNIGEYWRSSPNWLVRSVSILGPAVLLTPLGYAFYGNIRLIKPWLGIGDQLNDPLTIGKQFLAVPKQIFVSGPFDPVHWLGRLPILSVFETVMFLLGAYFYVSHFNAARSRFIIILSLLAWVIIAVGNRVSLSLIIPVIYLVLTTGIAYMLHEWLKVFPKNPVARGIGITVISIAILLTSLYQTRSYFVAWRNSPDTRSAFTRTL